MNRIPSVVMAAVALLHGCAASSPQRGQESQSVHPTAAIADDPDATEGESRLTVITRGTGKFYAEPAQGDQVGTSGATTMQLSFVDTEIPMVVGAVLGDALGQQFTVDPEVKGNMTLQSTAPVAREQLFGILEAALRLHDVALVPARSGYRVVPMRDAPRSVQGIRTPESKGLPGYGIEIVPLQHISVAEVEKILEPLAAPGSVLRMDAARNLLILAGTGQERAALIDVIKTFDIDVMAGMSFAIFPLEFVEADAIAAELEQVLNAAGSPLAKLVRLVPVPRLSALLGLSSRAEHLEQIEAWVRRLDVADSTPGRRIHVYDVQNGRAADLAASLGSILSDGARDSLAAEHAVAPAQGDAAATRPITVKSAASGAWSVGRLRVVPSEGNNSLLIMATPSEYAVIQGALKKLDVAPRQVLIEATLAEVTLNDQLRFGIQWFSDFDDGNVTLSQSSGGGISSIFPGFSYVYTGSMRVDAVLNALEGITEVKVVSSPKLLVLNNHEAYLQVGDQVPIVTQTAVSVDAQTAPIVNSVQMRDTGVILRVTPRVNSNGLVMLDVSQEVSDVATTTTSGIDSPTIQQRRMSSTVAVHSGQTIALGGLIRENTADSQSGLPWLQRIPLLGRLLGSTNYSKRRTELMVLMTPRVMHDYGETRALTTYLRKQFRELEFVEEEKDD